MQQPLFLAIVLWAPSQAACTLQEPHSPGNPGGGGPAVCRPGGRTRLGLPRGTCAPLPQGGSCLLSPCSRAGPAPSRGCSSLRPDQSARPAHPSRPRPCPCPGSSSPGRCHLQPGVRDTRQQTPNRHSGQLWEIGKKPKRCQSSPTSFLTNSSGD